MKNDQGGFASAAIANSVDGLVVSTVNNFNGEHDLAIIEFPDSNEELMNDYLDEDQNVITYR